MTQPHYVVVYQQKKVSKQIELIELYNHHKPPLSATINTPLKQDHKAVIIHLLMTMTPPKIPRRTIYCLSQKSSMGE